MAHTIPHALKTIGILSGTASMLATDTSIPVLSGGLKLLSVILAKVEGMSVTVEGIKTLNKRLKRLNEMLIEAFQPSNDEEIPTHFIKMFDELWTEWAKVDAKLDEIRSQSRITQFLKSEANSSQIAGLIDDINVSLHDFMTGMTAHTDAVVRRIQQTANRMEGSLRAHAEATESGFTQVLTQGGETQTAIRRIEGKIDDRESSQDAQWLPRSAAKAQYNAVGVRKPCLEGTRRPILDRLCQWVKVACTQRDVLLAGTHKSIFWMSGLAGAGKTTIAFSVVKWCKDQGFLCGNFFCNRSDAECKDPEFIFTTISRQLCDFSPAYKEKVITALQRDPGIQRAAPSRQFEELIVRPLEELKAEGEAFTCAIVIDALDECEDPEPISTILTILADSIHRIAGFLIFIITSRPEPHITALFEGRQKQSLSGITEPLPLHMEKLDSVLDDIRRYFDDGFAKTASRYRVEGGWPSARDMNRLSELSCGLFIWAATALSFVMDPEFDDPEGQLKLLTVSKEAPSTPDKVQSNLYDEIFKAVATKKASEPLRARLRTILGVIATAQEALSLNALADLTGCSVSATSNALNGLRSVLQIPEDPNEPILIIHPTFPEYLLAPSSTKPGLFQFGLADEHLASLKRCLNIMNSTEDSKAGLKRNILELECDSTLTSEIPDLPRRIKDRIFPSLSYACRYWSTHLSHVVEAVQFEAVDKLLRSFLTQHLLHWLEVCGYLDSLEGAILALDSARRTYQKFGTPYVNLCLLLADLYRFALTYVECISASPLEVYHSALVHAPRDSKVKQIYGPSLRAECSLVICRGAAPGWSRLIGTLQRAYEVHSVAFSPNGRYLATSSAYGVEIWNLTTRTVFSSITFDEVNDASYFGAAFCPDGAHIAVSVYPVGVAIFEVSSGRLVQILRCGDDSNGSWSALVYVVNGSRLFAVTGGKAKLWECSDWRCIHSRHVDYQSAATVSPQGTTIAYIEDFHMRLFVVSSDTYMPDVPLPHEGWEDEGWDYRASFSPNGRQIAIAKSHIVRILNVEDATVTQSIVRSGSRGLGALVFSPDGRHLAWCDWWGMTRIARIGGGNEDEGHTWDSPKAGRYVTWSPDGTQLGLYSEKTREIVIWDSSAALQRQAPHSDHPPTSLPLTQASRFAILYPTTTQDYCLPTLLSLPLPAFAGALASVFAHQDLYTVELCADMADAMDIVLQRSQLETRMSAEWAYLTGQYRLAERPYAAVSPNGELVAWRHSGGVSVYNLRLAKSLATLTFPGAVARNFVFSPNSALLAVAWQGGTDRVCIYRPEAESPICSHIANMLGLAFSFSPDSSLITIELKSLNAGVIILDWQTERVLRKVYFSRSLDKIHSVALTADGKYLLAQTGFYSSIIIFDTVSNKIVYEVHRSTSFNFSPDDTGLLIHGEDGEMHTLKLWNPGERVWPVYWAADDGWVYAKGPGRTARLCWLPPHLREIWTVSKEKFCAVDREQKRAVVFDVTRIPAYIENWGSESE